MHQITKKLLAWFSENKRPLPWRTTYNPYHTWIAEIMMQQTQMERGISYFKNWIQKFPTLTSVANASEDDLLLAWEGLGYYRRVKNLQLAAKHIVDKYNGIFPNTYEEILSLPGVGTYTAAAIVSTVFNRKTPCIDANVERVISRLFDIDTPIKTSQTQNKIYTILQELIPRGNARNFNQSLMEFGALVCKKNPVCNQCIIEQHCISKKNNTHSSRPVKQAKGSLQKLIVATGILTYRNKVFIQRRLHHKVWENLWEFPNTIVKSHDLLEKAILRLYKKTLGFDAYIESTLDPIPHKYSNYNMMLYCFNLKFTLQYPKNICDPHPKGTLKVEDYQWTTIKNLTKIPLPSPYRKIIINHL